ncbi:DUF397 domain-containing protein [Actinomadura adrarensis]|uniref:DUF397 domain-containing protein n=1 Tax=Actinomadura adrarensis TaxID=1819600 RepID=A0ABW3CCF3_9ACTN
MDELKWRKSSKSSSNGGECVELASLPNAVAVRDSKDPHGPKLLITRKALKVALEQHHRDDVVGHQ